MRVIYTSHGMKAGSGRLWDSIIRIALLIAAGLAVLAVTFIGLFVVLPLMLIGGIVLHFYLRRRLRQARARQPVHDGVIDAEYTVVEHR